MLEMNPPSAGTWAQASLVWPSAVTVSPCTWKSTSMSVGPPRVFTTADEVFASARTLIPLPQVLNVAMSVPFRYAGEPGFRHVDVDVGDESAERRDVGPGVVGVALGGDGLAVHLEVDVDVGRTAEGVHDGGRGVRLGPHVDPAAPGLERRHVSSLPVRRGARLPARRRRCWR